MAGTLYVVATPIGNLEDFTFRARRILGEVDLIAAEDTRRTSKLLAHYEIRKPLLSLHEHNEFAESPRLVARLMAGQSIALVTDAGTPAVADPGARLVRAARAAQIPIVPIPGASAVTTMLSVAGSETPEFTFYGFPPVKGKARQDWFNRLAETKHTSIFFEAPHRIRQTLDECLKCLVNKHILIGRELTKMNEELVERPNTQYLDINKDIGEFVIAVMDVSDVTAEEIKTAEVQQQALDLFESIAASPLISHDLAVELTALKLNLSATDAKKAIKKAKILVKQQNN